MLYAIRLGLQAGENFGAKASGFIEALHLLEAACKEKHDRLATKEVRAYPMYSIPMIASKITSRIRADNCVPMPTRAERRAKLRGGRKTSPCTSFHPDSSLTSLSWYETNYKCRTGVRKL